MDKKLRKQRYYTFMIVPHDASGKTHSFRLSEIWVKAGLAGCGLALVVVLSSLVYSSMLSRMLANYHATIARNRAQQTEINNFSLKTEQVNKAIAELRNQDNQLRKLLGLKGWKSKIKLGELPESSLTVSNRLQAAEKSLAESRASLDELKTWVKTVQERFAQTPSRWPVYGQLVSFFGYRNFPWSGFHSGIDISGSYGTSIRVTADGTVRSAGWLRGYGKAVIVDHGYGRSTLYGHCSKLLVSADEKVKKGQVIANIGTTGYSTGPHLHYEVRKWDRAVNPTAFLDLNLLSASRTWRD